MAGHLPGAGGKLRFVRKDGAVGVALGEAELPTVLQRMEILKKAYGDRFFEMGLKDFLKSTKKKVVPEGADGGSSWVPASRDATRNGSRRQCVRF